MLGLLCAEDNKVIRSSWDVTVITMTTTKNTTTAPGMIVAVRLGRIVLQAMMFFKKVIYIDLIELKIALSPFV